MHYNDKKKEKRELAFKSGYKKVVKSKLPRLRSFLPYLVKVICFAIDFFSPENFKLYLRLLSVFLLRNVRISRTRLDR